MSEVAKAQVIVDCIIMNEGDIGKVTDELGKTQAVVSDTQQAMANMVAAVKQMTSAVTEFANTSVGAFTEASQAEANLRSKFSGTQEEYDKLIDLADELEAKWPVTGEEIAGVMEQLTASGRNYNDVMKMTPAIVELAVATNSSLGDAMLATDSTLKIFDTDVKKVGNETNFLASMTKEANMAMPDLTAAMKAAGETANALGVDVYETGAALAVLRKNNVDASSAGMNLKMIFAGITESLKATEGPLLMLQESISRNADGTLNFSGTLQNLNGRLSNYEPIERQAILADMFGARAANNANILLDEADSLHTVERGLEDYGVAQQMAEDRMEGAEAQLDVLNNQLNRQQEIMGERLLPVQIKINEAKIKFMEILNELPGGLGQVAIGIGMVVSEGADMLSNVMMMASALVTLKANLLAAATAHGSKATAATAEATATSAAATAQWSLNAALLANPIVLIIVLVVAIVALIVLWTVLIGELEGAWRKVALIILLALGPIGLALALIFYFKDVMALYKDIIWLVGDAIKAFLDLFLLRHIRQGIEDFKNLGDTIRELWETMTGAYNWIVDTFLGVWDNIKESLQGLVDNFLDLGTNIYNAGREMVTNFVQGILDTIDDLAGPLGEAVEKIAGFFGGSPPHFGPLKLAMDKGPQGFIKGYTEGLVNEARAFVTKNESRSINIPNITFNNSLSPGMDVSSVTRKQVIEIMKLVQLEATR